VPISAAEPNDAQHTNRGYPHWRNPSSLGILCGFARRGYVGLPHSLHTPRSGVSVMLPLVIVIAS
jgi:hypothetical protein